MGDGDAEPAGEEDGEGDTEGVVVWRLVPDTVGRGVDDVDGDDEEVAVALGDGVVVPRSVAEPVGGRDRVTDSVGIMLSVRETLRVLDAEDDRDVGDRTGLAVPDAV